jgi:hypothetical protein
MQLFSHFPSSPYCHSDSTLLNGSQAHSRTRLHSKCPTFPGTETPLPLMQASCNFPIQPYSNLVISMPGTDRKCRLLLLVANHAVRTPCVGGGLHWPGYGISLRIHSRSGVLIHIPTSLMGILMTGDIRPPSPPPNFYPEHWFEGVYMTGDITRLDITFIGATSGLMGTPEWDSPGRRKKREWTTRPDLMWRTLWCHPAGRAPQLQCWTFPGEGRSSQGRHSPRPAG